MSKKWAAPRMWPGETVVCLGGGPSLTQAQADFVHGVWRAGRARVIAINDSYRLAPWADALYACDARWWDWHKGAPEFEGLKVSQDERLAETYPEVRRLTTTGGDGFDPNPAHLRTGKNGGYQAIHLAVHLGARRIVLLGYDMKQTGGRSHWHEGHPVPNTEQVYARVMLPHFETLLRPLDLLGVEVLNATPGSALEVFPTARLEDVL